MAVGDYILGNSSGSYLPKPVTVPGKVPYDTNDPRTWQNVPTMGDNDNAPTGKSPYMPGLSGNYDPNDPRTWVQGNTTTDWDKMPYDTREEQINSIFDPNNKNTWGDPSNLMSWSNEFGMGGKFIKNPMGNYTLDTRFDNTGWDWTKAPGEITGQGGDPLYKTGYTVRGDITDTNPAMWAWSGNRPQSRQIIELGDDPIVPPIDRPIDPPPPPPPPIIPGDTGDGDTGRKPWEFSDYVAPDRKSFAPMETWQPESFQFSPNYNQLLGNLNQYNPAEPDLGNLSEWSQTPVNYTPDQIESMYSGDLNRLKSEQEYGLNELMQDLQEKGLGRSGEMYPDPNTPVGRLLTQFGEQRSNVVSDVLKNLIPQQEQLSQQRRALGLQGQELKQTGYRTGVDLLSAIGASDLAAGQLDETKLNNAASRARTASQDAIERGNFELAADLTDFTKWLQQQQLQLTAQGQSYNQDLSKTQTINQLVMSAINSGITEEEIRAMLKNYPMDILSRIITG